MTRTKKLYMSAVVLLATCGAICVLANVIVAAHDSVRYHELPLEYREAIARLENDWHYAVLSSGQHEAVLAVHKKWASEGRFPRWRADPIVDLRMQKEETLHNFRKLVPRWGTKFHQRHPFWVVFISFAGFIPLLALFGLARWCAWLEVPDEHSGQKTSASSPHKKTSLATASLVCGICGLAYPISILFLVSIAGIVCGHKALARIKTRPDEYEGTKRARAGLIISYVALGLGLILGFTIGFLRAYIQHTVNGL